MPLTSQQLQTLKADILADGVLNAQPNNSDGAFEIMKAYNLPASPSFTVWKSLVPLNAVGMAIDFNVVAGLTTADSTRLQTFFQMSPQGINPYLSDRRVGFDNIFSGAGAPAAVRAALLVLWKRVATRGEKLFANVAGGDGANATPATLVFEGNISTQDVVNARNLP